VTQWAERTDRGRERGPVAVGRAWLDVLTRPQRFFARKIAPGDQAPGLTFAAIVVFVAEAVRIATVADGYPVVADQPAASAALWLLAIVVLVVPAGIHLTAALQTVVLVAVTDDRAGVSETVQVICYSLAPLVALGVPNAYVQALVVCWSGSLLIVGTAVVHKLPVPKAIAAVSLPGVLLLGYGFGGNAAVWTVAIQLVEGVETILG